MTRPAFRPAALAFALALAAPAAAPAAFLSQQAFSFATRRGPVDFSPNPVYTLSTTELTAATTTQYGGPPVSAALKFSLAGLTASGVTSAVLALTINASNTSSIGNPSAPLNLVIAGLSASGAPVSLADFLLPTAPVGTVAVSPPNGGQRQASVDVTTLVQTLLSAGFGNVEFRLDVADSNSGAISFATPNDPTAGSRPTLGITTNAVPEPGAAALLAAGLATAAAGRAARRRRG